ncbi:MAG: hypothetical protein K1X31_02675 [Gemmatimonadaceae bacterium]|nr:hypothetical protein [Gemmatimonadaceae bacterium]
MRLRPTLLAAVLCAAAAPAASAQDIAERLQIHASINMGYGKSDNQQTFGITKDGTSEYRAVALQFGYAIDDNDRVVTQFLHRYFGASPLNDASPDFYPVWAFYEHAFENGTKVKLGRAPLPRGLFNEVRFVGTLLPFYRVGRAVYGETLEQIDGVVVSKPWDVGSFRIETYGFAGGFDLRAVLADAGGTTVYEARNENTVGTQVWVNTPIEGVRFGGFVARYNTMPFATVAPGSRSKATITSMVSAEAAFSRAFVRSEYTSFDQGESNNYNAWYAQAGVKPVSALTVAAEYQEARILVGLPAPVPSVKLPLSKELTVGLSWSASPNVAFKLEGHQVRGYDFDTAVPTIIPPVAPPFIATIAPATKSHYILASVAVAF